MKALLDAIAYAKGNPRAGTRTAVLKTAKPRSPAEIKRLRRVWHLTQVELARAFAVTPKAIEAWENGSRACKGPALRLFELYEASPNLIQAILEKRVS